MKGLLIFIAITLFVIFMCVAWSTMNQEKINMQLEKWDQVLKEAEK